MVARRLASYSLLLWSFILSSIALAFYVPFVSYELSGLTWGLLIFILVNGIMGLYFGTFVYYEALKKGNRALVGTISSSFPAIAILVSVIFLGERITIPQIAAIVIIFIGLILSGLDFSEIKKKNILADKSVILALVTMVCWGTWIALLKIPISRLGWFWPNYLTFLLFPLLFIFLKIKKIKIEIPSTKMVFVPLVLSTALVRIAEFSYNLGISRGLVTIVAPIAGANPTLFVILAFIFLKDKITKQQIGGIIITLVGIVLLSFLSV